MREAIEAFEQDFAQWDLHLPADAISARRGGQIREAGWSIRYNFGTDARGEYLDYYASGRDVVDNPPGDDLHVRIYESGERAVLPTVLEAYMYGRDPTWEELERARRKYEEKLEGSAPKAPAPDMPRAPQPRPAPHAPPPVLTPAPGSASIADPGVVGLPPLDTPDAYLALDIGLDLDLDIDLEPPAPDEVVPPATVDLSAQQRPSPTAPFRSPSPSPSASLSPSAPPQEENDLTPRLPMPEMDEVVLADEWTITSDHVASSDKSDDPSKAKGVGHPIPSLGVIPPEERAAIEVDTSELPATRPDKAQDGDLVLIFPTSLEGPSLGSSEIPEAHQFVDETRTPAMAASPPARPEPRASRPTAQPPAEAVAALAGFGLGGTPPRREPPKPGAPGKGGRPSRPQAATARRPAGDEDDSLRDADEFDDSGLPVDAEMFKPWWFRSGGRRKAMVIAAAAAVLLAIGFAFAHAMHWSLPGSASSEAAQAVDSVNAASAPDHTDAPTDSSEPADSPVPEATTGADSATGAAAPDDVRPAAQPSAPAVGSAPSSEGGMVKPAGPNSVPPIMPSRRPGQRAR